MGVRGNDKGLIFVLPIKIRDSAKVGKHSQERLLADHLVYNNKKWDSDYSDKGHSSFSINVQYSYYYNSRRIATWSYF